MQHTCIQDEEWKPVIGYEGIFEVSNYGRVRSLDRMITNSLGHTSRLQGRIRKLKTTSTGHQQVPLKVSNSTKWKAVHRLVLEAFQGACPEGMEGCHNDGNPAHNHIDNLRWDTRSNNAYDKGLHGTDYSHKKTHCNYRHLLQEPNLVAWFKNRGTRNCLSCNRARAHIQRNPHLRPHMQEVSDSYYKQIMQTRR